jgi:hypothetical protein
MTVAEMTVAMRSETGTATTIGETGTVLTIGGTGTATLIGGTGTATTIGETEAPIAAGPDLAAGLPLPHDLAGETVAEVGTNSHTPPFRQYSHYYTTYTYALRKFCLVF